MIFFIVKDFIEGDSFEMLYELGVCIIVGVCFFLLKRHKNDLIVYRTALLLISLCFMYAVCIGSGEGAVLYWIFFIPLTFIYFLGEKEGAFWTGLLGILLAFFLFNPFKLSIYPYEMRESIVFFSSLVFVSAVTYLIEQNRSVYAAKLEASNAVHREEKQKSEKALHEIKVLQGLLPICSYCKKIRGDEGYWQDVAVYIQNNSNAEFTHSICPVCEEKFVKEMGDAEKS